MASFKNRIVVPKIKQPSLPISTILRQDQAIRVSHAPCMSHGIIEVLKEATFDRYDLTQKTARVHFIPNLKVGVFVTLCTPDVINAVSSKIAEYMHLLKEIMDVR